MRSWIVGEGANGRILGAKLHNSGEHVTLIARGKDLAAMQANNGMKLIMNDGSE